MRSVPRPDRQVYWNWFLGLPQAPSALAASPDDRPALVDDQVEVLPDGRDLRAHRHVPTPPPDRDAAGGVDDERRGAVLEGDGGLAVGVEAAPAVAHLPPGVEHRHQRVAEVHRYLGAVGGVPRDGFCGPGNEMGAHQVLVHPGHADDLARVRRVRPEAAGVEGRCAAHGLRVRHPRRLVVQRRDTREAAAAAGARRCRAPRGAAGGRGCGRRVVRGHRSRGRSGPRRPVVGVPPVLHHVDHRAAPVVAHPLDASDLPVGLIPGPPAPGRRTPPARRAPRAEAATAVHRTTCRLRRRCEDGTCSRRCSCSSMLGLSFRRRRAATVRREGIGRRCARHESRLMSAGAGRSCPALNRGLTWGRPAAPTLEPVTSSASPTRGDACRPALPSTRSARATCCRRSARSASWSSCSPRPAC